MPAQPTISVIIPTHNRARLLSRSIQSVLAQTFQGFEILVVDDASSDNTGEVVSALQDPRIRYLRHDTNKGGAAARNIGVREAQGRYIAFLDSDDEWLPEKLEMQFELFRSTEFSDLVLVSCGRRHVWPDGMERVVNPSKRTPHRGDILYQRPMGADSTGCFLLKRDADAPLLFDETLPALQDWEFLLRAAERGRVACVPVPLLIRHMHVGDHVHSLQNVYQARKLVLTKYLEELRENPRELAGHYLRIAKSAAYIRRRSDCAYFVMRSVCTWPWDWRMYPRLVAALVGTWPRLRGKAAWPCA